MQIPRPTRGGYFKCSSYNKIKKSMKLPLKVLKFAALDYTFNCITDNKYILVPNVQCDHNYIQRCAAVCRRPTA